MIKTFLISFCFLTIFALFDAAPRASSSQNDESDDNCSICLSSLAVDELKTLQNCSHSYHRSCIDQWLQEHNRCPVCRSVVKIPDELPPNNNADGEFNPIETDPSAYTFDIPIQYGGEEDEQLVPTNELVYEFGEPYENSLHGNTSDHSVDTIPTLPHHDSDNESIHISRNIPIDSDNESVHSVDASPTIFNEFNLPRDENEQHSDLELPSDGWQPHRHLLSVQQFARNDSWEPYEHLLNVSDNESEHSVVVASPYNSRETTNERQQQNETDSDNESVPSVYMSPDNSHAQQLAQDDDWEPHDHLLNANDLPIDSMNLYEDALSSDEMNQIFYAGAPLLSTLPADQFQRLRLAAVGSTVTVHDKDGQLHTVHIRKLY